MQDVTSLPTVFRALVAKTTGSSFAEVATVVEQPMPSVDKGEVLVHVAYAGVNGGCETFRARGDYAFAANKREKNGFALGAEGVGTVVALGEGVCNVQVGDAVCFVGGAFAEYSKVQAQALWVIPHVAPEYVGLRISALTSCAMLEQTGRLRAGETVLVTAAAGGAGHFAVQIAKLAGCIVIGTCSSEEKANVLRKLGCDHVINHRRQNVASELARIAPAGVDAVLEGVGGEMLHTALEALAPKGRLLQVGYISEYPHNPKAAEQASMHTEDSASLFWKAGTRQRGEQTIFGNAWPKDYSTLADCKEKVLALHAQGKLVSIVDSAEHFVGLGMVSDAIEYMLSGKSIGKVVVRIDGSPRINCRL